MESSCFICGSSTVSSRRGASRNFGDLKKLLTRICEVLSVSEVTAQDWDFVGAVENQQLICCLECYDLLKNVDRLHEIFVKTQKQLKYYLGEVQRLIVKSEEESERLQSSLWNLACFDFRTSVLNRISDSNGDLGGAVSEVIWVKKETEIDDDDENDDCDTTGWNSDDNYNDGDTNTETVEEHLQRKPAIINEEFSSKVTITKVECPNVSSGNIDLPRCSVTIEKLSADVFKSKSIPLGSSNKVVTSAKKRKIDAKTLVEDEVTGPSSKSSRRSSPRAAKKSAEAALKQQYAIYSSDKEEDNEEDGDPSFKKIDEDDYDGQAEDQTNYDNDTHGHNDSKTSGNELNEADIPNLKQKSPVKRGSHVNKSYANAKSVGTKTWFYPLMVADENDSLYLYRRQTFVRKTYTHLQCLAYECTFQTEWDFYPSFQLIKKHIEDKHRTKKYISSTPHPCLLCNILFDTRDKFYDHTRTAHDFLFTGKAKSICESCLMHNQTKTLLLHAFKHKNEEEKAAARESNQAPTRYSSKQMNKAKTFTCDFENCTKSFTNASCLKRHKQTHLPKELRTDAVLCPECGDQLIRDQLKYHMETKHHPELIDTNLVCHLCDKRFHPRHSAQYEAHMRRHRGDRPFLCPECGSAFVSIEGLNGHIRHKHRDQGPYPCEWCDCIYPKYSSWNHHVRTKHPDKWKKKRRWKSTFYAEQEEVVVRTGEFIGPEQRFPCQVCEIVCKYKTSLKKHLNRKHGIGEDYRKIKRPLSNYRKGGVGAQPLVEDKHKPQEIDDNSLSKTGSNDASGCYQQPSSSSTALFATNFGQFGQNF